MAEVLAEYPELVFTEDGITYRAQACGAPRADGRWEGWIEFIPLDPAANAVRSGRETTQPNRADALYWASGLTAVYLEGALQRALDLPVVRPVRTPEPVFEGPKESVVEVPVAEAPVEDAVLDPFSVYEKGEALLRRQLAALSPWHLVNIVLAYELSDLSRRALNRMSQSALIELIVTAVAAAASKASR